MKLNPLLLTAFVLVLALGIMPGAYALTDITGCQEITVADTYQLTGNLFVNAGTDPTVTTYGACLYTTTNIPVTIEGNGFLLDASNTTGTEVAIRFSNTNNDATINNIRVGDNWDFSIDAINNVNINITNNDLDAPINLQHSGIANILNNDIDSSDLAILHESNGAEETYIDNNNLTCTNIVTGNGGCIDTAFYGTATTYSITNNLIENYAVPFGYAYYYDFSGGNILNYIFDNNYIYERLTAPSLVLFGGGTLSIDSNTWTNEGADGHSETCTNDGTGYCVEDYEVFSGVFDTNSIALTPVACTPNWVCVGYGDYGACQIDNTQNASCNTVIDTNACGESYTGDYSEFPDLQQACDYYSIEDCRNIETEGTYTLTNNITGNSANSNSCLYVSSDDVTIEAGTYTVDCDDVGFVGYSSLYVENSNNFTLNGGRFVCESNGMQLLNVSEFELNNNYIYHELKGIYAGDSVGGIIQNGLINNITIETYPEFAGYGRSDIAIRQSDNIEINGGTLSFGSDYGASGITIWDYGAGYNNTNFNVHNVLFDAPLLTSISTQGMYVRDVQNISIHNNTFGSLSDRAIRVVSGSDIKIYDNYIDGARGLFVYSDFAGSEVYGNTIVSDVVLNTPSANIIFYDNLINSTGTVYNDSTIQFNLSTTGNTWTNPTGNGFSDTCTNDGLDVCVEDYNLGLSTDYYPVALSVACIPDWGCDGYATPVCLIDDTSTASCNSAFDNNACGFSYSGDYSEFANETGSCDYCTPSWSCDGYFNGTCTIINGTGTSTYSCNSVTDSNNCYATTLLPSDDFTGNPADYGSGINECSATVNEKISYSQGVLLGLLPLIFICMSCLVYIGINFGKKNKEHNNTRNIMALVVIAIIVLLLLALL